MEMHCCKIHLGQHHLFLMCLIVMLLAVGRVGKIRPTVKFTVYCAKYLSYISQLNCLDVAVGILPLCIANSSYCAGLSCLQINKKG